MKTFLVCAAIASIASCGNDAPGSFGSAAPHVSMRVREADRKMLLQAAGFAKDGSFDQAKPLLKRTQIPEVVTVAIAPGATAAGKTAVEQSVAAWKEALNGAHKIELVSDVENATIIVEFVATAMDNSDGFAHPGCSGIIVETDLDASKERRARLQVATALPGVPTAQHTPVSLAHLVSRGIGAYLGLANSSQTDSLMGPDTHSEKMAIKPAAGDIETISQFDSYHALVAKAVESRTKPDLKFPQLKFAELKKDGGECWRGETLKYEFEYKNEGQAPLEIEAKPSCGCTIAKYDKVVQPGESGKLVASLNTAGFKGSMAKTIDIYANTPDGPAVPLVISARVKPTFSVTPAEPVVFPLADTGASEHEVIIRPLEDPDTKILTAQAQLNYVTAKLEPMSVEKGTQYKVILSFKPEAPRGRFGTSLRLTTDSKREPQVNIPITFEKGIYAMPPSIYIGLVNASTKLPMTRVLSVIRRSKAFHVKSVSVDDPALAATVEPVKDGHEYRITLTYKGGWKSGPVNRKVKVTTDDPDQAVIEIPVLANVMAEVGGK